MLTEKRGVALAEGPRKVNRNENPRKSVPDFRADLSGQRRHSDRRGRKCRPAPALGLLAAGASFRFLDPGCFTRRSLEGSHLWHSPFWLADGPLRTGDGLGGMVGRSSICLSPRDRLAGYHDVRRISGVAF